MEVMNSLLGGLSGMNTSQAMSAAGNVGGDISTEGGDFGGILSGMMNPQQNMVVNPVIEEATVMNEVTVPGMSDATLNALENLLGAFFGSKTTENEDGTTDFLSEWSSILENMGPEQVMELSQFSAMLETTLTEADMQTEETEEVSFADLLSNLFNTEKDKTTKKNEEDNSLMSILNSGMMRMQDVQSIQDIQVNFADIKSTDALSSATTETVTNAVETVIANTPDVTDEVVSQDTEEATLIPSDATNEQVKAFSEALENVLGEKIEKLGLTDISYKETNTDNANSNENGNDFTPQQQHTQFRAISENINHREIRYVDVNNNVEKDENVPKINLGNRTDAENVVMAQRTDVMQTEDTRVVFPSEEEAAYSVNTQTAEQILGQIRENNSNSQQELVVKLNPKGLGQIDVKITHDNSGQIGVTLAAHNSDVATLLRDHSSQLVDMLTNRGSEVSEVNVVLPSQEGQEAALNMGAGAEQFYSEQRASENAEAARGNGRRISSDDEDDEISAIETTNRNYVSKEAKLWTTA